MKRIALALLIIIVIVGGAVAWRMSNELPQIPAHRIAKGSFVDQVTTNGRVEPSVWSTARAEREGLIIILTATKGHAIAKGAPIALLDSREAQADLASANARIEEAKAIIQSLESGGRKREIVEIEQALKQRAAEKSQAEKDLAIAERLLAKNAGTREEVRLLKDKLELMQLQIATLEARRPTLVASSDIASAQARLREASAAADLAHRRIELSTIRSPIEGIVYQLDLKPGAFVTPGTLIASIGRIDDLKVTVYVDEPELGRIRKGMPVSITWDALEGKRWQGTIESIPTQVVALGARQVGEIACRIANPERTLIPGTNVNAFIETRKLESVLIAPKEAVRILNGALGVYQIENNILTWRKIETGLSNVTTTVIQSGLKEGDQVALGPEANLKPGAKVAISN